MSNQNLQAMMDLLDHATWAEWGNDKASGSAATKVVKPSSKVMNKALECLEAIKKASEEGKTLYRECPKTQIAKHFPSLPCILRGGMDRVKNMEGDGMKTIQDLIYGGDDVALFFFARHKTIACWGRTNQRNCEAIIS